MQGMRPRVLARSGAELLPAMTVLLVPLEPQESTAYLKFQVQCTNEPQRAYDAGIRYFAASYYQVPEQFSDEMTAVFGAHSPIAQTILETSECLLDFEQYGQRYTMFCSVRSLAGEDASRQASLWHNRIFNPELSEDSVVLAFLPDWKNVHADPMPPSQHSVS